MRSVGGDGDADLAFRAIEKASMIEPIASAAIVGEVAAKKSLDDVDRLAEAFPPLDAARPTRSGNVLVEALSRAEAEREAGSGEEAKGRGALGNDRRMVAHNRACHGCHQADPVGRIGDGAEHRPSQRCVSLFLEPRRNGGFGSWRGGSPQ
jgi:hypothetical protein